MRRREAKPLARRLLLWDVVSGYRFEVSSLGPAVGRCEFGAAISEASAAWVKVQTETVKIFGNGRRVGANDDRASSSKNDLRDQAGAA